MGQSSTPVESHHTEQPQQASIRLATARENRAVLKRKHFDRDAQENNKLATTKVKTEEEELEEFRTRWYNENITIQKVVRLEQFLGHPVDLWDLYSCARFSNEEIDWLDENGVLYWLLDGPILSASDGQLLIDGSNSSLCDIIRICPQDQDLSKFIGVAMV